MIDHVLGRPSVKSRRLQVLGVLAFWTAYLFRGHKHGPPLARFLSHFLSKKLTLWQTVVITMIYLYAARNFSTLVGIASSDPLANMYDAAYFRATWVLTALDAGFWTAMKIRNKWTRDLASIVFSVFYMFAAESADEKVRQVRANLTVQHLRVSWNKGTTPYLRFFQGLLRPRFSRYPPRMVRIPRPENSDYKEPITAWLYYDNKLEQLKLSNINKVVLDLPGGGFVAMDPRCNDDRLLSWSAKLGFPILSIDYKKAPEYPYPYALNEAFDAYTSLIQSRGRCIGMNGREVPKIVVCGDSAGGNLATAMTLMITESASAPIRTFMGQIELPLPDGLILFYPGLDMNIGNWMSDEQMALIKDRRMRATNKAVIRRKSMVYSTLAGTPHDSDDEAGSPSSESTIKHRDPPSPEGTRSPAPEFSHITSPLSYSHVPHVSQSPEAIRQPPTSYHPEPLRTRLAMSSMLSYFNDRILTPEMMRAMIILYVGPHNRPDFSQDYHLSPILAPDILLARFPKTYFLTGERDPLVDDTVIFAGRLRRVKAAHFASGGRRLDYQETDAQAAGFNEKDVAEVVLVPGISHGFLQFPTIYPPAWKWIDRSAGWIEEAFRSAEVRAVERRRALINGGAAARQHVGARSSDDEDRPLEMSMSRGRRRGGASGSGAGSGSQGAEEDGDNETERSSDALRKRRRQARTRTREEQLARLASEDDLLGRRMNGLIGGLTGVTEE